MSAQVTEAHSKTAEEIGDLFFGTPAPHWQERQSKAAQLIADSEARAVAPLKSKVDYAEGLGLRIGLCKTSDKPDGFLAHCFTEGTELHRMFDEWTESIGIKELLEKVIAERDQLRAQVALDEKAKALMLKEHFRDVDEMTQLRAEVTRLKEWQNRGEYAERFNEDLKSERDQLRAEVKKLHEVNADFDKSVAEVADFKANGGSVQELVRLRAEVEKAKGYITLQVLRAETAEREVERLKACVGLRKMQEAIARAARAEAELAKERARLGTLHKAAKEYVRCSVLDEQMNTTECMAASEALDAAMKEDVK